MKHRTAWMMMLLLAALCAFAQEPQTPRMPQRADRPAMPAPAPRMVIEKPREAGPGHKVLEPFAGTWKTEVRLWPDAAATAPTVSKGTVVFKMILGGRYVQGEFKGEEPGTPFNALEILGFDNAHLKYTGYWIDNTSTTANTSTGTASAEGKVLRLSGRMSDPDSHRQMELRTVISFETPDKVVFQAFAGTLSGMSITTNRPGAGPGSREGGNPSSDERKLMEIVCTRVKG
jgi:hypothetical protein